MEPSGVVFGSKGSPRPREESLPLVNEQRWSGPRGTNGVNCIKGEIHNVLAVMRANRRWASGARFKREIPLQNESPLMRSFKTLHKHLETLDDLIEVDTVRYLQPFIDVIKSVYTTGPMTGTAIASVNKFILYNFIQPESIRAKEAINLIASAVSACRFEATEQESDEMVIMKLLEMTEYCLRSSVGHLITEDNVWSMFETILGISRQSMVSLLLQRSAENTLAHIVLTLFSRISEFAGTARLASEPQQRHSRTKSALSQAESVAGLSSSITAPPGDAHSVHSNSSSKHSLSSQHSKGPAAGPGESDKSKGSSASNGASGAGNISVGLGRRGSESSDLVPYGVPLLRRVLEWLSGLVCPSDTDEGTRVLALTLINIVLETAGSDMGQHPPLVEVLQGDLCKYLLQNSQTEDLTILSLTLRVVFNLFNSIKHHLKVQLEVFFTSVHMRIVDSPSCTNEQKELAMESLLEFCREPALMLDIYTNYDCDVHCTNLFESLCRSLARNAIPEEGTALNILNLLAYEGLRAIIESIASRCPVAAGDGAGSASNITAAAQRHSQRWASIAEEDEQLLPSSLHDVLTLDMPGFESESDSEVDSENQEWLESARERTAEILHKRKRIKKRMLMAAESFNNDRKGWIAYVQQLGLLPNPVDAESVANFLLQTPGLDKTTVGDYICEGPPEKYRFNEEVRNAYVKLFDFCGLTLDEALRRFLERFRLPGEAQKIERIMETFSKHFYDQRTPESPLANADAAFILSYSIIMLNTDLHNTQVARKMTLDAFIRNNRGINDGKDLPVEFLTRLYENIKASQIKMQQDASDLQKGVHEVQWDGVMKRSSNVVDASFTSNEIIKKFRAGLHEREMFGLLFEPGVHAVSVVYQKTSDDAMVQKTSETFHQLATISVYFEHVDHFNELVVAMAKLFIEHYPALSNQEMNHSASGTGGVGADRETGIFATKANRALWTLQALFGLARQYGNYIRKSWKYLVHIMLCLNELDALPDSLVEMDDFVDSQGVPLPSGQIESKEGDVPRDSVSRVRARSRKRAQELAAKKAEGMGIWSSLSTLLWAEDESEDANAKIKMALREAVENAEISNVFTKTKHLRSSSLAEFVQALIQARDPTRPENRQLQESEGMMEENAVLSLEILANVAIANHHRLEELWSPIHSYFERVLQAKGLELDFLVERIVVNILRVCIRLLHKESAQPQLLSSLHLIQRLGADIPIDLIDRIASGLFTMLKANALHIKDLVAWNTVFGALGTAARHPNGRQAVLDALDFLVENSLITTLNFQLFLDIALRYIQEFNTGISSRKPPHPPSMQNTGSVVEQQAVRALRLLQALAAKIANPSGLSGGEMSSEKSSTDISSPMVIMASTVAVDECWLSILRTLFTYVDDERDMVARVAWSSLQNSLLLPGAQVSASAWKRCFDEILFKLHTKSRMTDHPMEIRLRNSTLLGKAFLHNVQSLSQLPNFHLFWLQMIKHMSVDLTSPSQSVQFETSVQALSNIINVMRAEGIFETASRASNQDVWQMTWAVLDTISPTVLEYLKSSLMLEDEQILASQQQPQMPQAQQQLQQGDALGYPPASSQGDPQVRGEADGVGQPQASLPMEVPNPQDISVAEQRTYLPDGEAKESANMLKDSVSDIPSPTLSPITRTQSPDYHAELADGHQVSTQRGEDLPPGAAVAADEPTFPQVHNTSSAPAPTPPRYPEELTFGVHPPPGPPPPALNELPQPFEQQRFDPTQGFGSTQPPPPPPLPPPSLPLNVNSSGQSSSNPLALPPGLPTSASWGAPPPPPPPPPSWNSLSAVPPPGPMVSSNGPPLPFVAQGGPPPPPSALPGQAHQVGTNNSSRFSPDRRRPPPTYEGTISDRV